MTDSTENRSQEEYLEQAEQHPEEYDEDTEQYNNTKQNLFRVKSSTLIFKRGRRTCAQKKVQEKTY